MEVSGTQGPKGGPAFTVLSRGCECKGGGIHRWWNSQCFHSKCKRPHVFTYHPTMPAGSRPHPRVRNLLMAWLPASTTLKVKPC